MLGAITGGILGAAAALLLTPTSGSQLRAQVYSRIQLMEKEIIEARDQKRAELEEQLQALRAPQK